MQSEEFVELPQLKGFSKLFRTLSWYGELTFKYSHFQRTNNSEGHIKAIRKFLPYCFSCNRNNYARNLSYYYIQMKNLSSIHPSAQIFLKKEGFTASLTGKSHSEIPMDQVIEITINP